MNLGWKVLIPISLVQIVVTGTLVTFGLYDRFQG
jgi:NADH:ubiquinone oxidoreductase subunit H